MTVRALVQVRGGKGRGQRGEDRQEGGGEEIRGRKKDKEKRVPWIVVSVYAV